MATFDQLPAEQRAILELVLQRRQSYDDLAQMLGMPSSRVRELAREALTDLSPHSARRVDDDWRGQVADYLLGQQTGPEGTATRGHLKRSEPARLWALSLIDSLDHLYADGDVPVIPEGEAAPARRTREPRQPRERKPLASDDPEVVRRRRIAAGAAAGVILLLFLLVWPIGLLTGGDDDEGGGGDNGSEAENGGQRVLGQLLLRPRGEEEGVGIGIITQNGDERTLVVQARGLKPTEQGEAYEVWLFNSKGDAQSMGAQLTDQQGNYQGAGRLPDDYEKFRFLDISREKVDQNAEHSGVSVLRGRLDRLQPSEGSGELAPEGTATTPEG